MALAPGTRLGVYEVTAQIGEGGMGQVYRARDTKLNRDVAIKVLLPAVANDPDRLARFSREAQVLASLNHPNIAHIYGVEDADGTRALVMELVEGPTLADRIAQRPIPLDEALPIAKQIAEALEAAHETGIIHRDLKPANIKVRPDGTVKVLDFGLAKAMEPAAGSSPSMSMSPTLTTPAMTQAGMILGTAAYMSPEQAKGRPVDKRSDIWAFGCVLYEMLTGRRAFEGEDVSDTLAFILTKEPDWTALPATAPAPLRKLLRRCLEKDRKRRLADAADARLEIDEALTAPSIEASIPGSLHPSTLANLSTPSRVLPWAVASALGLGLAVVLLLWAPWREAPPTQLSVRFQIPPPGTSAAEMFTLSADGRHLAFIANTGGPNQLWLRDMEVLDSRALAGTDGARYPFWSPDGGYLGFFAQGKLKKISIAGGPPQTLCDATDGRGGTWNRDGVIVFSAGPTSPLVRVSAAGGVPAPVTTLVTGDSGGGHRFPVFLPDGVHLLYTAGSGKPESAGLYLGALDGGTSVRLLPDGTNALYAPPATAGGNGYLIFRREETLMAQPFDAKALKSTGEMFPIAAQVPTSVNIGFGAFSVSASGALVYRAGGFVANRALVWMDRAGKRLGVVAKPGALGAFAGASRLSPDEATVAVTINNGSQSDIWLQDLKRDVSARFTFGPGFNRNQVWSPDGKRVVFARFPEAGAVDIYQKSSAGTGQEELLLHAGVNGVPLDWSPDGKWIVYQQSDQKTALDLWLLPLEGDRKPIPYLQTPFNEANGAFSPDGRWMAYQSNESGQDQIYVQTIPASGAKYQISNAGGVQPTWRRDGKELFYVSTDQKLMAVPIVLGARVEPGTPQALFPSGGLTAYAPTRDGQRFLVNVPAGAEGTAAPPITVVLNWTAGLKP